MHFTNRNNFFPEIINEQKDIEKFIKKCKELEHQGIKT